MKFTSWGLVVIGLGLPTYLVRLQIWGLPTNLLDILVGVAVVIFVRENWREIRARRLDYFDWGAGLILMGATVGVLVAPEQKMALGAWKSWIFLPLIIFEMMRFQARRDAQIVPKFLVAASASAGFLSLWGLGEIWSGTEDSPDGRLQSIFTNANQLALLVAPLLAWLVVALCLPQFRQILRENFWQKIGTGGLALALGAALILSRSYGGFLALGGSLALAFWFLPVRRIWKMVALGILVLALGSLGILEMQTGKFAQMLDLQNRSSSSVRLEIWQVAAGLGQQHLWAGIGPNQFQHEYQRAAAEILGREPLEWNHPQPHNLLLAFWLQTGLWGLAGFLLVLLAGIPRYAPAKLPYYAALGVILLHGLIDTPFWRNDLAIIFWVIVAGISAWRVPKKLAE